jgi:hypothetical protein
VCVRVCECLYMCERESVCVFVYERVCESLFRECERDQETHGRMMVFLGI